MKSVHNQVWVDVPGNANVSSKVWTLTQHQIERPAWEQVVTQIMLRIRDAVSIP